MNLVEDKWIPSVTVNQKHLSISILDAFENKEIADISVKPHERVSLYRLLICIRQICDIRGEDISYYLIRYKEWFNLYDEKHPFLQISGLRTVGGKDSSKEWVNLNRIDFTKASGLNSTFRDRSSMLNPYPVIEDYRIALNLIAYQNFHLAGGISSARMWDNNKMECAYPKDGPCSPRSMYHSFIVANNLIDTITLNVIPQSNLKIPIGVPVWEKYPISMADTEAIENATKTHLGRLVPLSRFLLIDPITKDRVLIGSGLTYPTNISSEKDSFPLEPYAALVKDKEGTLHALSYRDGQDVWKCRTSFAIKRGEDEVGGTLSLNNINDLSDVNIISCVMIRDKASIIDIKESFYRFSSAIRTPAIREKFENEISYCISIEKSLGKAIHFYKKEIDYMFESRLKMAGAKKMDIINVYQRSVYNMFWTFIEINIYKLIKLVENEDAEGIEVWRKNVLKTAKDSFRTIAKGTTAKQLEAYVKTCKIIGEVKNG